MPLSLPAPQNPYASAHATLLERLAQIVPPKAMRVFPAPADFEAAKQYLTEIAEVVDDLIAAVGFQVSGNSPYSVDERSFNAVASDALSDACYECENIADRLRDDRRAA